ncbi:MAG: hypothetical protein FJ356_00855 [Thaumarchaeota archaeon]|nr:hypothetical protein [Nitrososphaerota archaeon]
MYEVEDSQLRKKQVSQAVENTLLELGEYMRDTVSERLKRDYNCQFSDCLENPAYLKIVLQDYFGDAYKIILDLIKSKLEEVEKPPIQQFLKVLAS